MGWAVFLCGAVCGGVVFGLIVALKAWADICERAAESRTVIDELQNQNAKLTKQADQFDRIDDILSED